MKTANIAELKNSLSKYLNEVKRGEQVLVSERNVPFAKIVPQRCFLMRPAFSVMRRWAVKDATQ